MVGRSTRPVPYAGVPGRDEAQAEYPMAQATTERRSVLVVDRRAETGEAIARGLEQAGCSTRVADGYRAALDAAWTGPVDALVCDLGLPDGDGCDLLGEVRALHPDVRAVALAGYVRDADRERCRAAGFHGYLLRPATTEDLLAVLATAPAAERAVARGI